MSAGSPCEKTSDPSAPGGPKRSSASAGSCSRTKASTRRTSASLSARPAGSGQLAAGSLSRPAVRMASPPVSCGGGLRASSVARLVSFSHSAVEANPGTTATE